MSECLILGQALNIPKYNIYVYCFFKGSTPWVVWRKMHLEYYKITNKMIFWSLSFTHPLKLRSVILMMSVTLKWRLVIPFINIFSYENNV